MSYATLNELATRFSLELLQNLVGVDALGELLMDPVEAALADASELIDSYAASRYLVPLVPVPAPVKRWCADISLYYLHKFERPEYVREAYLDALEGLRAVSKGSIDLQSQGLASSSNASGAVEGIGAKRVFSQDSFKGF